MSAELRSRSSLCSTTAPPPAPSCARPPPASPGSSPPSRGSPAPSGRVDGHVSRVTCHVCREALRTVEELCQGKQSCSILTSPASFGVTEYDPCPGIRSAGHLTLKTTHRPHTGCCCRKYIEVVYKCHPTSLSSRLICGGASMGVSCTQPGHALAVLAARFQQAASGPIYCPLQQRHLASVKVRITKSHATTT